MESELKPNAPRLRLRVTTAAENRIRQGHPWLFNESIREANRSGVTGELAVIYDRQDRFLAIGLFDAESPIRLRVLQRRSPEPINSAWWLKRLAEAVRKREGLFDPLTNGYRCVHGENDGLPGLVLDRYAETLVLKIYTAAWLPHLRGLVPLIQEAIPSSRLVLRTSRNTREATQNAGFRDGEVLVGPEISGPVVFQESGIQFEAEVLQGQKTGFFLDQRENRRWVESIADRRRVLNAFSFSGGFSLYAARGGAGQVTNLDLSAHALSAADRNRALNLGDPRIRSCEWQNVQADAFEWLAQQRSGNYELVVLDPPSLAKRESERAGAIQAYRRLARLGWAQLGPQGILAAASCSAHVSAEEFFEAVHQGLQGAGHSANEIHRAEHPPDHPASFPEARYLKCVGLRKRG